MVPDLRRDREPFQPSQPGTEEQRRDGRRHASTPSGLQFFFEASVYAASSCQINRRIELTKLHSLIVSREAAVPSQLQEKQSTRRID